MKTLLKLILTSLLLTTPALRAADVLTVAVFDFESKDEGVRDLGPKVATLLNANLSAEPQIITVERAELEKVLGEQELGLSGTVSPDTAAKVGHLTGAKVLVTGRVFKADKEMKNKLTEKSKPSSFISPTTKFSTIVSPRKDKPTCFLTAPRAPSAPITHSYEAASS